jgi:hypothetical protein
MEERAGEDSPMDPLFATQNPVGTSSTSSPFLPKIRDEVELVPTGSGGGLMVRASALPSG